MLKCYLNILILLNAIDLKIFLEFSSNNFTKEYLLEQLHLFPYDRLIIWICAVGGIFLNLNKFLIFPKYEL